jgi:hypothetical protein
MGSYHTNKGDNKMGYFQEQAGKAENVAKRLAKAAEMRAELRAKRFDSCAQLAKAYADAQGITEAEAIALIRQRWTPAGERLIILSNPKSAYSAPWGYVTND